MSERRNVILEQDAPVVGGVSVSDPRWDEARETHDWRNYVGSITRAIWHTLTPMQQYAIAGDAHGPASIEEKPSWRIEAAGEKA